MDRDKEGQEKERRSGQGGYLPRAQTIPVVQIRSNAIRGKIDMWKEKTLIRKFVGVWPKEKDLVRWIQGTWKLKGHYDLQLGAKGLFTIISFNQEDQDRVLEGGPYFFFSAGLFLRPWRERFNLESEDLTVALVWIRLVGFSGEYWDMEIL